MSGSRYFDKIAWIITSLILVVTILIMNGGALGLQTMTYTMGYENRLFDNTKVHKIDIVMNDWDEFIDNATTEEYYVASVVVDGEAYKNVGIRGKGNTSLSTVSSMNSDRYSFKIEFDHYDNSITYHGLDKLSLNNLIQDSTMMKDYLTYTMMNEFDTAAPLCSFVYITVNGEDWGLYLAVEGVENSFLKRNYGSNYGELYKPDSMSFGGGRGNGKDFNMNDFMNRDESDNFDEFDRNETTPQVPDMRNFNPLSMFDGEMPDMSNFDPSQMQGILPQNESGFENRNRLGFEGGFSFDGMGGFGMGSSDVKLQYIDDDISNYSNIWNNAKTDITLADQTRLIESLKKLAEGEQIESVVDIDNVLRYFVVHNYVCNGDSYTGSMIHNYYLYEENGKMSMIPWDYNLAFGTFQGNNAQSSVNTPIDAPVSGGYGEDRPMWNWILSDETYIQLYHQYFAEFLNTVDITGIIENAYNLIKSYVEKDPTAFYTYDEFESGVETMMKFCIMRSDSVTKQLLNGETTSNMSYVDASSLTLSDMGSMGRDVGFGGMSGMDGNRRNFDRTLSNSTMPVRSKGDMKTSSTVLNVQEISLINSEEIRQSSEMMKIMEVDTSQYRSIFGSQISAAVNDEIPSGFNTSQMSSTFSGGMMPKGFDPNQKPVGFDSQMQMNTDEKAAGFNASRMYGKFVMDMTEELTLNQTMELTDIEIQEQFSQGTQETISDNFTDTSSISDNSRTSRNNIQTSGGNFDFNFNMNVAGNTGLNSANWIWLGVSILILCIGLIIAKLYKY